MSDSNEAPKAALETKAPRPLGELEDGTPMGDTTSEIPAASTPKTEAAAENTIKKPTAHDLLGLNNAASAPAPIAKPASSPVYNADAAARTAIEGASPAVKQSNEALDESPSIPTDLLKKLSLKQIEKQWNSLTSTPAPQDKDVFAKIIDDLYEAEGQHSAELLNMRHPKVLQYVSKALGVTALPAHSALTNALNYNWHNYRLDEKDLPTDKAERDSFLQELAGQFMNEKGYTEEEALTALLDKKQYTATGLYLKQLQEADSADLSSNPLDLNDIEKYALITPITKTSKQALNKQDLGRKIRSFLDNSLEKKQLGTGQHIVPIHDKEDLALLVALLPQLALDPAVLAALRDAANKLGLSLEEYIKGSRENRILKANETKDITQDVDIREQALSIFSEKNSVAQLFINGDLAGFNVDNSSALYGTGLTFYDKDGTAYTHRNGVTKVRMDKTTLAKDAKGKWKIQKLGTRLNASMAMKTTKIHLSNVVKYTEQGEPAPLNLEIYAKGKTPNYARDLSLLSALNEAHDKNLDIKFKFYEKTLLGKSRASGPYDFKRQNLTLSKLNKDALAHMEHELAKQGRSAQELLDSYNKKQAMKRNAKHNAKADAILKTPDTQRPITPTQALTNASELEDKEALDKAPAVIAAQRTHTISPTNHRPSLTR